MLRDKLFDVYVYDRVHGFTEDLRRGVPLLDDSLDETLLDDEGVAALQLSSTSTSKGDEVSMVSHKKLLVRTYCCARSKTSSM
jgi:hypothetical protein